MNRFHDAVAMTPKGISLEATEAEVVDVARRSIKWLEQESEYQSALSQLLEGFSHVSPFQGSDGQTTSSMSRLLQEREELESRRQALRAEIGQYFGSANSDATLSILEARLPPHERQLLRDQRLRLIDQLEANRQRLRSVEVTLARQNSCVIDVLAHLLGQTSATATYGADGRQSFEPIDPELHAVS